MPRQAPAAPAAAPQRAAQPPARSWAAPDPASRQGRLFYGGSTLLLALVVYLCGFPTDAIYMLLGALLFVLHPL